jgi:hypothetical protein
MGKCSRDLVVAFAKAVGLEPSHVAKLTLEANAKNGILVATVVMYPPMSQDDLDMLISAIGRNPQSLELVAGDA